MAEVTAVDTRSTYSRSRSAQFSSCVAFKLCMKVPRQPFAGRGRGGGAGYPEVTWPIVCRRWRHSWPGQPYIWPAAGCCDVTACAWEYCGAARVK